MIDKEFLMIPGPTPLPPRVIAAMTHPMINHRGPLFKKIFTETREILKKLINPDGDIFLIPSSGTGAMELAVQNFTNRGDKVIVVDTGFFGDRFFRINLSFGRDAVKLKIPYGRAVKPEEVVNFIKKEKDAKALFLTHNETSTAVANPLKEIVDAVRKVSDMFIIVDAVSSMGILKIDMREWGIDVVVGASQKGLMSPPGIGIVGVSKRALDFALGKDDSYYFGIKNLKAKGDIGQPFTTFPVSTLFGLREALNILLEEGFEKTYERHRIYKKLVRESLKEIGLKFVANDEDSSPCVTAVFSPEGINGEEIVRVSREKYNVEIASIQGDLKGKAFRIGHMGYINSNDLLVTVASVESTLYSLGYKFDLGSGVKKFINLRLNSGV
ncbi:MAG: alanine--glyoxylate aminotransferase family protein [Caldisericia bacterium]|nr:alanine--glyoxylate aminotransferase family protein [Caldisericia bacterium]